MAEGMRVCEDHPDYVVPLLWTFAFIGAEYWCPYCGYKSGMLGAGIEVEETSILEERRQKYKESSKMFLRAMGRQIAVYTEYKGQRIKPSELPGDEKEKDQAIISNWQYGVKIEAVQLD